MALSSSAAPFDSDAVQHDAHVRAHRDHLFIREMTESSDRRVLLARTSWDAAANFTDGTLDNHGIGYHQDSTTGRKIASVTAHEPTPEDNGFLATHSDIPENPKILSFFLQYPSSRTEASPPIRASLQIAPISDNRFRLLSFAMSDDTLPLSKRTDIMSDLLRGMDDFMTRVATRRGKVCTVVDATDTPTYAQALCGAGYRVKKGSPGKDADASYEKASRDMEILRAVFALIRHGIQLQTLIIDSGAEGSSPLDDLPQHNDGAPYYIILEKQFHPLKNDTMEALLARLQSGFGGIIG